MPRKPKVTDEYIPPVKPLLEDFWDVGNEHDLQAMIAEQAELDAQEVSP